MINEPVTVLGFGVGEGRVEELELEASLVLCMVVGLEVPVSLGVEVAVPGVEVLTPSTKPVGSWVKTKIF